MGVCHIVGAGDFAPARLRVAAGDYLIAADAGYDHLSRAGIRPDLALGDFDSIAGGCAPPGAQRYPVEKDDTDMMLAVKRALAEGWRDFRLYGALGGARMDHSIANLQTLCYLAKRGARAFILDRAATACAVHRGEIRFGPDARGVISVFATGGAARGVSVWGLKYTLEGGALTDDVPLGVSNHFIGEPAGVRVEDGTLMVMWQGGFMPEGVT